jgi:hypothetical protein
VFQLGRYSLLRKTAEKAMLDYCEQDTLALLKLLEELRLASC